LVKEAINLFKDVENQEYEIRESEKLVFSVPDIRLSDVNIENVDEDVFGREICDIDGKLIKGGNASNAQGRRVNNFVI